MGNAESGPWMLDYQRGIHEPEPAPSKPPPRSWRLELSIWAPRKRQSDGRTFYNDETVMRRAFSVDWRVAVGSHSLNKLIRKYDDGPGGPDGERTPPPATARLNSKALLRRASLLSAVATPRPAEGAATERGSSRPSPSNLLQSPSAASPPERPPERNKIDDWATAEVEEVESVLWMHHRLLYAVFDYYASVGSGMDIFGLSFNGFKARPGPSRTRSAAAQPPPASHIY